MSNDCIQENSVPCIMSKFKFNFFKVCFLACMKTEKLESTKEAKWKRERGLAMNKIRS